MHGASVRSIRQEHALLIELPNLVILRQGSRQLSTVNAWGKKIASRGQCRARKHLLAGQDGKIEHGRIILVRYLFLLCCSQSLI
jgi:hypothetical protein